MTQISLRGLHKSFGTTQVVRDLNLEIADREFLVLLGPSGCGKTTTMRMVAGLEQATHGEIAFDGRRVNEVPTRERDVAMVFQNYGLYPHMTVAENIAYPRQRVALARSIVRKPQVFLMDEPLSNLDAKLRVAMRAEIKHLAYELQVTTLYVTHDQIEAMTLANRVAIMKDGVIIQLAAPEVIYADPINLYVAGFIGSPAMNLIEVQADAHSTTTANGLRIDLAAPRSGALTLGVRPEDMRISSGPAVQFSAELFAFELLGDSTMMTFKLGSTSVAVKGDKNLRLKIGDRLGVAFDPASVYWFDSATGLRVRAGALT